MGTPQPPPRELNATEERVIAQVAAGEIADLREEFPLEEDRVLGAKFLEYLLTNEKVQSGRIGIQIKGAIFKEIIDLTNATVLVEVGLEHCRFGEKAIFERASFARKLSFEGTIFNAEASFNAIKVQAFTLPNTVFEGAVDFVATDVATTFEAQGMKCNARELTAIFSGMKVGRNAFFNKARFEGPVNFVRANITNRLEALEAQFCEEKQGANFNGMKVGDDAFFKGQYLKDRWTSAQPLLGGNLRRSKHSSMTRNKEPSLME